MIKDRSKLAAAMEAFDGGYYREALQSFDGALCLDAPEDPETRRQWHAGINAMAETLLELGLFERANRCLQSATADETAGEQRALSYFLLARVREMEDNYDAAVEFYHDALLLYRQHDSALTSQAACLGEIACLYVHQGHSQQAAEAIEQCLSLARSCEQRHDYMLARAWSSANRYFQDTRDNARSAEYAEAALRCCKELYDYSHPTYARARLMRASVDVCKLATEEAASTTSEALATLTERMGSSNHRVADAVGLLAAAKALKGNFRAAEELIDRAVEIKTGTFGAESYQLVPMLQLRALVRGQQGKTLESIEAMEHALRLTKKRLGDESPRVAQAMHLLSSHLHTINKVPEATAYCQQALARFQALYGKTHPTALKAQADLANLLMRAQRIQEAESVVDDCLEKRLQVFSQDTEETAHIAQQLGTALMSLKRVDDACSLLKEAHEIYTRLDGPDHLHTKACGMVLQIATMMQAQRQTASAEAPESLAVREKRARANASEVTSLLREMVNVQMKQGLQGPAVRTLKATGMLALQRQDYAEAESAFKQLASMLEQQIGPDEPEVGNALCLRGLVLMAQRDYTAIDVLKRAVAILEARLGANNEALALPLDLLAGAYGLKGDTCESEALFERCLSIRQRSLGRDHAMVSATAKRYAQMLRRASKEEAARRVELRYPGARDKASEAVVAEQNGA